MMKHVSNGVYKRDSIILYFDGGKRENIKNINE